MNKKYLLLSYYFTIIISIRINKLNYSPLFHYFLRGFICKDTYIFCIITPREYLSVIDTAVIRRRVDACNKVLRTYYYMFCHVSCLK